jgi:hypothetical protein
MAKSRTIYQDTTTVVCSDEATAVERMRKRDTDGDGVCDLLDREYNKPSMQYMKIDQEAYDRLMACDNIRYKVRKSKNDDKYIVGYKPEYEPEILNIINRHHTVIKHI